MYNTTKFYQTKYNKSTKNYKNKITNFHYLNNSLQYCLNPMPITVATFIL